MGRAGRKGLSSGDLREHWTETHPDRDLWSPGRLAMAQAQTQEEYEALYGRGGSVEVAMPSFLEESGVKKLQNPFLRQVRGNELYWLDQENFVRSSSRIIALLEGDLPERASAFGDKLALLTDDGELHIYRAAVQAPEKLPLGIPERGNLQTLESGVLVYNGYKVDFRSFAELPGAPLSDVFRNDVEVPGHSHADVFVPGRDGALMIHRGDYSVYQISYIGNDGEVRTPSRSIDKALRGAENLVHCEQGERVVFACSVAGEAALYELDFESERIEKVVDLQHAPQDITTIGTDLFLLYEDGSYQLMQGPKVRREGQLPGKVLLERGGLASLSRDKQTITSYRQP